MRTKGINLTYGIVRIGNTSIGIPIDNLSEVFHINGQQELPINSDLIQGGVDLRGKLVPVLNLSLIGRFGRSGVGAEIGFVLEYEEMSVAFYVDEIISIVTVKPIEITDISDNNSTKESFFRSVFPFEDQFVSILNVAEVFSIPGILTVKRADDDEQVTAAKGSPMLTFMAGGALYSIPAVEVHAAVPKQSIKETAITSGPCLGEISYHGRRIPVVCPVTILGLGNRAARSASEVVVLRFSDDLLLGIAVDAIRDIRTFQTAKEAQIPLWQAGQNFIRTVLVHDDGEQTYVVDVDLLRTAEEVADIAHLSRVEPENQTQVEPEEYVDDVSNVVHEKEQYLIIDLHKRIAIPLLQVSCILEKPKNLTPTDLNIDGFRGYFSRFGESIALIDLRERFGEGQVQHKSAKVLMTGKAGEQIGFLVDNVIGIEISVWREIQTEDCAKDDRPVVQLGSGGARALLPFLNLDIQRNGIGSNRVA